jgi:hypothetical protein
MIVAALRRDAIVSSFERRGVTRLRDVPTSARIRRGRAATV